MIPKFSSSPDRSAFNRLKKIFWFFLILSLFTALVTSCLQPEFVISSSDTRIIIWDPEKNIANYKTLTDSLQARFPHTVILSEYLPDTAVIFLESEFSSIPEEALCLFILVTSRPNFHISSEWNLWFPEIWRKLDCKGKIMIADGSWGDEFLNPVKTYKEDTIWVINGKLGNLRRKLPGSLLAASCRFDERNLISRGIDGKTKTPLFSWYFINELCADTDESKKIELVSAIEKATDLTQTARSRGIVSDVEETLFFRNSEINREEFRTYPNPIIWNGLAKKVFIEVTE